MSISKRDLQYYRSLKQRKFRQKYNKFPAEGDKIIREALRSRPDRIRALAALPEWFERMGIDTHTTDFPCLSVSPRELQQLSAMPSPNQAIAWLEPWTTNWQASDLAGKWTLYLDGLQDPGNLGTLLRIADWFGLERIFASPDSVDLFNPKVVQASMGAFLRIQYERLPLPDLLAQAGKLQILGADMEGEDLFKAEWPEEGILILGREGSGIRPENIARITRKVRIPGRGQAESLNAAVAGGIIVAVLLNR